MKDYKTLKVFQKTRAFNTELYNATKEFPEDEKFGITSQVRRASISIACNIAEGCGRDNNKEFARFLNISYASACEVECLLFLASDLTLISPEIFQMLTYNLEEIKKMLFVFIQRLKTEIW